MRKGFQIYEEMRKYSVIFKEVVSHLCLCNCSCLNFHIYKENLIFFFISVKMISPVHFPRKNAIKCLFPGTTNTERHYMVPPPLPLRVAKAGRNHLNEKIIPLLSTGIGERYSQTISNLGHAALLRRCELPL